MLFIKKAVSLKFSILSFLMTCTIVFYHFKVYPKFYLGSIDAELYLIFNNIFECLGSIAMGYFFTTTGYFMYRKLSLSNVRDKIKKRFFTLVIPYLIWNLLYYIYELLNGDFYSLKEFILRLIFNPFDGPLWYVLAVFGLALLSPLFVRLFRNKNGSIIGVVLIYIICFFLTNIKYSELINFTSYGWYFERLIRYLPNYFTGLVVGLHFEDIIENSSKKIRLVSGHLLLITFLLVGGNLINSELNWIINRIQPFLVWYMFRPVESNIFDKIRTVFNSSFIIYATHSFLISGFNKILSELSFVLRLSCGLGWIGIKIFITFIIVLCAVLMWYILKKMCPKCLNVLTGGR